jgi:hypothetical protein
MARGRSTTKDPPQTALPKVEFVKVEDSEQPAGVHDGQARAFGCQCPSSHNKYNTEVVTA